MKLKVITRRNKTGGKERMIARGFRVWPMWKQKGNR